MRHAMSLGLIAVLTLGTAQAETDMTLRFDVRFGLFHPAAVTLHIREDGTLYAADGVVVSTGLVSVLRDFHFDLSVQGQWDTGAPQPDHYVGDADTGRRQVQVEMRYASGLPTVLRLAPDEPPQRWSLNAADQAGAVDPLTALYRMARPQPRAGLCGWSMQTFDGRRRVRVSLDAAQQSGDAVVCDGAYLRLAGYSPADLAERLSYPFTVRYQTDDSGQWQLTRVDLQTPYGRMRMIRQF